MEMGLITEMVVQKWHGRYKKYYIDKGYEYTKVGDGFWVKVEDLPDGSNVKVEVECDNCNKPLKTSWHGFMQQIKKRNSYYCNKCAIKLFGNGMQNKLHNNEVYNIIHNHLGFNWEIVNIYTQDHSTQVDIVDPQGYMYGGVRINGIKNKNSKPFRFHKSNPYSTNNISLWCKINNKKFNISKKSIYKNHSSKLDWCCHHCNKVFQSSFSQVRYSDNFQCPFCGDNVSYPQKFIRELLSQLNEEYIPEYSPEWSMNKRYDFYLPKRNEIWEVHGMQHYEERFKNIKKSRTLQEEQENDEFKKQLSEKNGCKYIVIDARYSNMEYIKNSLFSLPEMRRYSLPKVQWSKCHEYACNNLVQIACDLWNTGLYDLFDISKIMKLHHVTIKRYLQSASILGMCNYEPFDNKKQVVQLTLDKKLIKEFDSMHEAERHTGISFKHISLCCLSKCKTAKGYIWMFKEDYIMNKESLNPYTRTAHNRKSVAQITLSGQFVKKWNSITEAKRETGVTNISGCCNNPKRHKAAGGYKWMCYEDYLAQQENNKNEADVINT